jgi:mannosyltransferase OCH1-like enzyme
MKLLNHTNILYLLFLVFIIVYLKKKQKNEGFDTEEIPKKVFQTWKTTDMPTKMKQNRERMIKLNPDFEYVLMDDEQCRSFIRENYDKKTLNAYDSLIPGAYKADLWRYCVLYTYGGIYLDIKLRPADDFKLAELIQSEHFVLDRQEYFKPGTIGLYNACMVVKKGNKCMKRCIERVVDNVEKKYYGYNDLYPTGPGLLGEVYTSLYDGKSIIDMNYIGNENIIKNGNLIIHSYPEYREEAPSSGKYGLFWKTKNVYQ